MRWPDGTVTQLHGAGEARRPARFYGCGTRVRRGATACANRSLVRHERLDAIRLDSMRATLEGNGSLEQALTEDQARRRAAAAPDAPRQRAATEKKLAALARQITNVVDSIAAAGPVPELVARLRACKAEPATLQAEQDRLQALMQPTPSTGSDLRRLCASAPVFADALARAGRQARHGLVLLLAGKLVLTPIGRRAYRFSERRRLGGSMFGAVRETSYPVVAPTGFEPVVQP